MKMVQPQGDSSFWYVLERAGRVVQFSNTAGASSVSVALDIRSQVTTSFEMGLLGLAIHPDYPTDNRVFLLYNHSGQNGRSILSSFTVNTSTRVINGSSESVLLTLDQPAQNHNGGDLAFGPNKYLYASFGDGGSNNYESQVRSNLYGTILRINVNTTPYSIPVDNPFNEGQSRCNTFNNSRTDICPEIFAYGLRNPWRFSIDFTTGSVWVGDVGDSSAEEANRLIAGGNYGWPLMEGVNCRSSNASECEGLELPIAYYDISGSQAVAGGFVYRGTSAPDLVGRYIFGDYIAGQFYAVDADASPNTTPDEIFTTPHITAALAEGNDGEVYLLHTYHDQAGEQISRIVSGGSTAEMPANLSETGCFNTVEKTFPEGVYEYSINSFLWSDGAEKRRAFALPDGTTMEVLADEDLRFPEDSMLIKHFLNGPTYLETRFLINYSFGWRGYSYEWNDAQTDAVLLAEGKTKDVGDFVHTFPSSIECSSCHTAAANDSLGIELPQLNRQDERINADQVDFLSQAGYFNESVASEEVSQMVRIDDTSATIEQRARSYLHVNCSGCHRPNAPNGFMDLRFSTDFGDMNICNVDAANDLGITNAQRFAPGNPDASVILSRMTTTEADIRMPPLARLLEDREATQVIRTWISQTSNCN